MKSELGECCASEGCSGDSQRRHPPVGASSLCSRGEDGQSDQCDGGGDGEGADVLQQQARQPAEANHHLDGAGDDDGALDLNHGTSWGRGGGGERQTLASPLKLLALKDNPHLSDAWMPDVSRVHRHAPVSVNLLCKGKKRTHRKNHSTASVIPAAGRRMDGEAS